MDVKPLTELTPICTQEPSKYAFCSLVASSPSTTAVVADAPHA